MLSDSLDYKFRKLRLFFCSVYSCAFIHVHVSGTETIDMYSYQWFIIHTEPFENQ